MPEENNTPLNRYLMMQRKSQEASQSRYVEESRRRLDKIISTKITTTFIGALSAFEKAFGFLWGYGKKEEDLTTEERQARIVWESVRTDVLNNGNNQLRALRNELQNHNVSWNRHTLVLKNEDK